MKLISCERCAAILDQDRIVWPEAYDEEGNAVKGAVWDGEGLVMPIACHVCENKIYKEE